MLGFFALVEPHTPRAGRGITLSPLFFTGGTMITTEERSAQSGLFDAKESERRKQEGMALAAANKLTELELARKVATDYAKKHGTCHADQVGMILKNQYGINTLGPATGSIFRTKEWVFTGLWVKSQRKSNHSRMIRVWRLKMSYE